MFSFVELANSANENCRKVTMRLTQKRGEEVKQSRKPGFTKLKGEEKRYSCTNESREDFIKVVTHGSIKCRVHGYKQISE